jgi:hypothetical protein
MTHEDEHQYQAALMQKVQEELAQQDRRIHFALAQLALVIILLISGALIVCEAFGDPITVRVAAVRGENALPQAQVRRMVEDALRYYDNACWINFRLAKFETIKNPFPKLLRSLDNAEAVLYAWEEYFYRRGSRADVRIAALPPFIDGGKYWLGGYATGTCDRGGTMYSNAEPKNNSGTSRVVHSAVALRHELGHLLGAKDRSRSGLMDTEVLWKMGSTMPQLDARSQWEIVKCAGGW